MIHHANVLANLRFLHHAQSSRPAAPTVVWLPHFHDMGLLNLLYALYVGSALHHAVAAQFAGDPLSWLRAISRYARRIVAVPILLTSCVPIAFRPHAKPTWI